MATFVRISCVLVFLSFHWLGLRAQEIERSHTAETPEQLRRISFEVAPGEGSDFATKFGEQFSRLPFERQSRVTDRVTAKAVELVKRLTGTNIGSVVHGTGGWQNFQDPAAVAQTMAPAHEVELQAAALGYLLQQTEVWVNRITDDAPNAYAVDFMEIGSKNLTNNERLKELWKTVSDADSSGLIQGYQPITDSAGRVGNEQYRRQRQGENQRE